jgi:hypothetical protein
VLATDASIDIEAYLRQLAQDFFAKGIAASNDPRASAWRAHLPQADIVGLTPDLERFPVRHQFGNVALPWWDERRSTKWTFSHDRMLYEGRDASTGAARGEWGAGGIAPLLPFRDVPAGTLTRSSLYAIDTAAQRQYELVRLPDSEWFTARPVRKFGRVFVQTNRRLLAYRPDTASRFASLQLDWAISLGDRGLLPAEVDIATMPDGWLVSLFYFDDHEYDGFEFLLEPWQRVVHVGAGTLSEVGLRPVPDHAVSIGNTASVPAASWWVSPPLYAIAHLSDLLDTGLTQPPRFTLIPPSRVLQLLALLSSLLAVVGATVWLRLTRADAARRRVWFTMCALGGLPAFLSMTCLEPRSTSCA